MKVLLIIITFLGSMSISADFRKAQSAYSKKNESNFYIFNELFKSKYYFSAVPFAAEHIIEADKLTKEFEEQLEVLLLKTGTNSLAGLSNKDLLKHKSPTLELVYALKMFRKKKYKNSMTVAERISLKNKFAPEALYVAGTSRELLNDLSRAKDRFNKCIKVSKQFMSNSKKEKLKRYYSVINESCTIHIARIYYKQKQFKKSIESYNSIPKASYRWPYTLIEKAWANYYLEDFNRSLGLVVTYKSPLLKSYFFPEAEVLNALSYYRLCLYNDTLSTIDQYYKVYKTRSNELKKIILPNKDSHTYFIKLAFASIKETEKLNPYIRNLVTQIRKKIKFSVDLVSYKKAKHELKYLKKRKQTKFVKMLTKRVEHSIKWRTQQLNHYVKKQMFTFINDIHKYSYEMFNIKLEVMSKQRDLIYRNKELVSNRSRGSFKNVNRRIEQHFWHFEGAFWADELGDYSYGLESNCKTVKVTKR
jgi:tetratricopeptide (TPR) repeat protein